MAGLTAVFDPDGAALELVADQNSIGFHILAPLEVNAPQAEVQWAGNVDTEGSLPARTHDENMEISPRLRISGSSEADFRDRQLQLEQKIHKLKREGGIFRLIYPDETWIDYWVLAVSGGEKLFDNRFVHHQRTEDKLTLTCSPFGLGQEYLAAEFSGSDRVIEGVIEDVRGSADANARAVITSPDADIWELHWGVESRHYAGEPTEAAYFPASELTPLGGAAAATATIEGTEVEVLRQSLLTPNWTAMLSTGELTHQGVYEVYLWLHMPTTNTGEVGVFVEYSIGDRRTELRAITFDADHSREGKVVLVRAGQPFVRAAGQGAHSWEAKVIANSTVAKDTIDVLAVGLRPLLDRNGRVKVRASLKQPSALLTRDEFNGEGLELNGQTIAAASSVTGPNNPASAANDSSFGTVPWNNVDWAKTLAGGKAEVDLQTQESSQYLKVMNPGISLPPGSVVDGIAIEVRRNGSLDICRDASVRIVKGGVVDGEDRARPHEPWGPFPSYVVYGSQTDKWGLSWSPEEIDADFGVVLAVAAVKGPFVKAWVDEVRFLVYWSDIEGQQWLTSGDATDFVIETPGHTAQRTAVSDENLLAGRYAVAGSTETTDIVVGVKVRRGSLVTGASERMRGGVLARYTDAENHLFFGLDADASSTPIAETLQVIKRVGGTATILATVRIPPSHGLWRQLWLHVDSRGRWFAWGAMLEGGVPRLMAAGHEADLAPGGVLASGTAGFYDAKTGAGACTRSYDDFVAWIPDLDAAIFEGGALELRHDAVEREVSGGGRWTPLVPELDYLRLAPAGMEGRRNRMTLIPLPNDPDTMDVGFPSDLQVAVYVTPRYRGVPDPASK